METKNRNVVWMEEVSMADVPLVGGKNASLGEMIRSLVPKGIRVPSGFIVTTDAYRAFLERSNLNAFINETLQGLDTRNMRELSRRGRLIRARIVESPMPKQIEDEITASYWKMEEQYGKNIDTAVRSSATAEDLPGASFAGEHETYLAIRGAKEVIEATKAAMASLFTDRAISYRVDRGFAHEKVALSVAVQRMVRSDLGCSGVMFTLDTESGFKDVILISAAYGLGEMVVQGKVTPDEFMVWKSGIESAVLPIISKKLGGKAKKMIYAPERKGLIQTKVMATTSKERTQFALTDKEVMLLAKWGKMIEEHYSERAGAWSPMDIEWAKDGKSGELYIVQARAETVHAKRDYSVIKVYRRKEDGEVITKGASVGSKIAAGRARVILDAKHISQFKKGEILVTGITDPDWEPIMKIAAGIVTDKGGRTSHAAIVSRELGIPAVVGTEDATKKIKTGDEITIDTTGSEGVIFKKILAFTVEDHDVKNIPKTRTKIMINIATPETAFEKSFLPNAGVGLAREEFIIASTIDIHPSALLDFKKLNAKLKRQIAEKTVGWKDVTACYVDNLAYGIAKIGAAFYPKPVITRFSDFKTNEYRELLGGEAYEPKEENPMIGWRAASRYYDPKFKEAFKLECLAFKKVREEMGLANVIPMIPFCRTPEEGRKTLEIMAESGLVARSMAERGSHRTDTPVAVYVMCEIPSNVLLVDAFLDIFDGMSIGSNDLTQLVLGIDRDSGIVRGVADENNEAVKKMIAEVITRCKERGKYIGICGQAPSDYPDFAAFLVERGIDSMSLNPDTVIATTLAVAKKEADTTNSRQ